MERPLDVVLALDQGTHASRALLVAADGSVRHRVVRPVALQRRGAAVEQDPEALVLSLEEAALEALAAARRGGMRPVAAGLATQRSTVLAWTRAGARPLTPAISWLDARGGEALEACPLPPARLRALTGLVPSAHHAAGKIAWLLRADGALRRAAEGGRAVVGPLAAFLVQRLTGGAPRIDAGNASRTLLYGLRRGDWEPALLEAFGVPPAALPACRPVRHRWGALHGTGLPLTAVHGDQPAALHADGAPRADTLHLNLGTGAFGLVPLQVPAARVPRGYAVGVADAGPSGRLLAAETTIHGAGAALAWIGDRRRLAAEVVLRLAAREPSSPPPLFVDAVGGLGAPWWRPHALPRWPEGEPVEDAAAVASVVEGMAFVIAASIAGLAGAMPGLRAIRAGGGLARLEPLLGRLAALAGLPVYRVAEPEATARGIAWLAAGSPARWRPAPSRRIAPLADDALAARFARARAALEAA
ncbi:FGGY family carbohydrate kinase [Inmirania thermothiophila]|uniref:Glycerol kinase n=1 Tax=Inmirania thermothiophila TaxID=1750597 RepID=A0A3N1XS81_9GAMM|nr:FGGY family carbohydrate kinase [Inmirania thermothiophila]ROR29514.1 glycerol kinase [Inmirania thermothiophila]